MNKQTILTQSLLAFVSGLAFLSPSAKSEEIEITIRSGVPLTLQSSDLATAGAAAEVGALITPHYWSENADPAIVYQTEYVRAVEPEAEHQLREITNAIGYSVFGIESSGMDRLDADLMFPPDSSENLELFQLPFLDKLRSFLGTHPLSQGMSDSSPPTEFEQIELRNSIPELEPMSDDHLAQMVHAVRQLIEKETQELANFLPMDVGSVIHLAPNRPNGRDQRFHIQLPSFRHPQGSFGTVTAEYVCSPMRAYWANAFAQRPLDSDDLSFLKIKNLPNDENKFMEILENDCKDLQLQINDYYSYQTAARNLFGAFQDDRFAGKTADERLAAIAPDIDALKFAYAEMEYKQSLQQIAREANSLEQTFFPPPQYKQPEWPTYVGPLTPQMPDPNPLTFERTIEGEYWHLNQKSTEIISSFRIDSLLVRPVFRTYFFALLAEANDGQFSNSIGRPLDRIGGFIIGAMNDENSFRADMRRFEVGEMMDAISLSRPNAVGVGHLNFDATYADAIVEFGVLRLRQRLEFSRQLSNLKERAGLVREGMRKLRNFHHVSSDGFSRLWPNEASIVTTILAGPGMIVRPGDALVELKSTQRSLASMRVPASVGRNISPGEHLRIRLSGEYQMPIHGSIELVSLGGSLTGCDELTPDAIGEGLISIRHLVDDQVFILRVTSVEEADSANGTIIHVEMGLEDNAPLLVDDKDLLSVAKCVGLPVVSVGGKDAIRLDMGVLSSGQVYKATWVIQ